MIAMRLLYSETIQQVFLTCKCDLFYSIAFGIGDVAHVGAIL